VCGDLRGGFLGRGVDIRQDETGVSTRFLPFKDGVPSHDTFGDVFAALDPEAFQACFVAWTASLAQHIEGWWRSTADAAPLLRPGQRAGGDPYGVGVVVEPASGARSGESGREVERDHGHPQLLDLLSLAGAIVTIDAIGCQTAIAQRSSTRRPITCWP